ncbi:GIY-YIG nuclease family protein [Fibrella forsythiae]|uniref:GIY-YIG nuclease family protein n=1 Tax=Fibrella forsythiae TaxID=2817061 RepID=A0ABS3JBA4_9BACT|nr:GIY-YIG nuclease family protein [Fibrella forsythiae]MBO0947273.1 GIY-YIG nuclease family protein [Fibrella forsythiae]
MNYDLNLDHQQVVTDYCNGCPVSEICQKYSLSERFVYKLLKRANVTVKQRVIDDAQVDFVVEEYKKGASTVDISKAIGFSIPVICKALQKRGISRRKESRWDHKLGIQIANLYIHGSTLEAIADQMNLETYRVCLFLEKQGIDLGRQKATPSLFTPNYTPLDLKGHTYAGVYKFTNRINSKVYIGSAKNIYQRYCGHARMFKKGAGFPGALIKYGIGNFDFEVIERTETVKILIDRETYWIEFYQACNPTIGYNLTPKAGTTRGIKQRPEVVEAHRKRMIGRFIGPLNPNWKKQASPETRAKMSTAAKGRTLPGTETRERMRIALLKRGPILNSKELIEAAAQKRQKHVAQINLSTGEVIEVWPSAKVAAESTGLGMASIQAACRGYYFNNDTKRDQIKESHGGYKWQYMDPVPAV